jgi:hypothetical protein
MKLLVYIPCHTDFPQAINQATEVRRQFESLKQEASNSSLQIEVIVSVNSYEPSLNEKNLAETFCDSVIYNGNGYLADVNISKGYLLALEKRPDLLWLLSTNDKLMPNAIKKIYASFTENSPIDLLVTSLDKDEVFIEKQIIDPARTGFSYGLISAVVYRLERIFPYLHNGTFMAWTGWSQLAVMQTAMDGLGGLTVRAIPFEDIYQQRERDLASAGKHYAHSIFGMLILGVILKKSRSSSKKFIRKFIFSNFYVWHLFSRRWKYSKQLVSKEDYLAWNQVIAESLIWKNSPLTYLFYSIFKKFPFENFSENKKMILLKRSFDNLLKQGKHYK